RAAKNTRPAATSLRAARGCRAGKARVARFRRTRRRCAAPGRRARCPSSAMLTAMQHNMKLLSQHTLNGHGGMGEGMSLQLARDGRRVLWLAHESAPKNFTAVDVTDPRKPRVIVQTDLPHRAMRSNSLEVSGDIMAVAYQVAVAGAKPAGFELFDISDPERPRSRALFDASAAHSRGCHPLWSVDGKTVHMACRHPELRPRDAKDDQIYRIVDVSNPTKPHAV